MKHESFIFLNQRTVKNFTSYQQLSALLRCFSTFVFATTPYRKNQTAIASIKSFHCTCNLQ